MKIKHVSILLLLSVILIAACAPITESTGKVLDSAGSVTRSASQNAWAPADPSPTPSAKKAARY